LIDGAAANPRLRFTATSTGYAASQFANSSGASYFGRDNSAGSFFGIANGTVVYSSSNDPIGFFLGASEQMRLTSTGLGIGTSSPSTKLTVRGATTAIDTGGQILATVTDAVAANIGGQIMMGGYWTGTTPAAFGGLAGKKENATDGNYAGYLQFITSTNGVGNTEKMRLDSSGNLGLGTTSPAYRLQVETPSATGNIVGYFRQGSGAVAAIISTTDLVGFGNGATAGETRIYADGGSGFVSFRTNGSERARIASGGNFGIGTTSPNSILDVDANTAANTTVLSLTNRANWGWGIFLDFRTPLTNGGAVGLAGRISSLFESSNNYALAFSTTASGTNAERARITSGGDLLVGTTTSNARITTNSSSNTSGSWAFFANNSSGANLVGVRGDGAVYAGLSTLSPFNNTTGTAANAVLSSDGYIYRSTSSLKYKKDVESATHGLAEVLALRSVTYKGKAPTDGEKVFGGLIAEEVHEAGLTEFVQYAEDGTPDALAYGNMVSLAFKAIQEQQALINSLKARLDAANL
jgi:hypothetical protein